MDTDWKVRGLCRDWEALEGASLTPDDWFRETRRVVTAKAKDFCLDCPVMIRCLAYAREDGIPFGVFGGEDKNEREDWWAANGGRPTAFDDSLEMDLTPVRGDNGNEMANDWVEGMPEASFAGVPGGL